MGNGLQNECKCRCPGDDDESDLNMQVPAYPGATSYIKRHNVDGSTGGTGKEPTFGCADLNSTWCCPDPEQAPHGSMVAPMPPPPMALPVVDPVFHQTKEPSRTDHVEQRTDHVQQNNMNRVEHEVPDPYRQEDAIPGIAFPQRDFQNEPANVGQPVKESTLKSSDRTSSSGRTASEWAADQAQFSHLPPLPDGWLRIISRTTGKLYYCYPETGETTFSEPTGPPPSVANKRQLPNGWVEMVSRSTGRPYYWNSDLQRSQFEVPTGYESPGSPATTVSTSPPPTGKEDPSLPPGWVVMVSRSTGREYYYHAASQTSQFERP
jgi:hypothetical protein